MTEMDPQQLSELEVLEGVEEAMESAAEVDQFPDAARFPVAAAEYTAGPLEEVADVEGFHQPRADYPGEEE